MSRRTILLIAATFFVLLGIPGIYLICTWSTHNPLRFEVTRLDVESNSSLAYATMDVTVRNTSNLPVYLDPPAMEATDKKGRTHWVLSSIHIKLPGGSVSPFFDRLYLPPGDSIPCLFTFSAEVDIADVRKYLESIEVYYRWRSGTVEKINELHQWLVSKGPENLYLVIHGPKDSHHRAPLELPATISP